jgi:uncharacterized protein DUF1674
VGHPTGAVNPLRRADRTDERIFPGDAVVIGTHFLANFCAVTPNEEDPKGTPPPEASPPALAPPVCGVGALEVGARAVGRREVGGREGPEPTRFGDWELRGRCIDF